MSRLTGLNPGFVPVSAAHGVLKSLLERPLQQVSGKDGEKEEEPEEGAEHSTPRCAFLGPALWDRTLPYDGDGFQLEYLDLDEFLSENGIPAGPAHQPQATPPAAAPSTLSSTDLSDHASTSSYADGQRSPPDGSSPCRSPESLDLDSPLDSPRVSSGYQADPVDLALSSVPGQETFDPQRRKFSDEELRPQPVLKKARKVQTPEDLKDDRYWCRRRKNNVAAKRSRDARRLKENQISIRAGFLETENWTLRQEVVQLRKELSRTKRVLDKYQTRTGPV